MSDLNLFAQWLRDRRKALRLTQTELAARAGLSFSAVQKLEGGQRRPSQQVAELLVDALKIAPKERASFLHLAMGTQGAVRVDGRQAESPTNLPAHLTPLVGRDDVLAGVIPLLRSEEVRLLTLIGSPGIGKTRLAVHVASHLLPDFSDGVFLVPLAPLRDPAIVMHTVAGALTLREKGTEPISLTLREHLREQKVLLVLDNFEQVVAAAPAVAELLWSCPHLKMLVTSREALHVRGERRYAVPSLTHEASVQLFLERAREVESDFSLTPPTTASVAAICARMEGVPLAIELVAARVRLMSPQAILARLESHRSGDAGGGALPLLVGGARDLPERHRTLRSAIAWSYDLMSPAEQRLYRRLGAFVGGCTAAAAQAVCNARDDLSIDLAEGLLSLLDKNLLKKHDIAGANEESRYVMLETVREYAAELLEENGENARVKEWHAEYYLALARAAESQIRGADQKQWLEMLEREHDNLRAALAWTLEYGDLETGMRTACALHHFWYVHGHLQEGLRWLGAAISKADEALVSRALLVDTLNAATWLAQAQSDYGRTIYLADRSVALAREEGDPKRLANALARLSGFHTYTGHYHEAKVLLEEALPLLRDLGVTEDLARLLNNLAGVTMQLGTLDASLKIYREALSIYQELNSTWHMALELSGIAHVLRRQGEFEQAAAACQESLHLAEAIDNNGYVTAIVRNCQGDIARCTGNKEQARDLYIMSLEASGKIHSHYMTGLNLLGLACLSAQEDQSTKAVVLFGALEALLEKKSGALLLLVDVPEYERVLADVRAALDEATFNKAWVEGRALTGDQLIDWLEEDSRPDEQL